MIRGDSSEYDLLEKWSSMNCDGFKTVEIVVRIVTGKPTTNHTISVL